MESSSSLRGSARLDSLLFSVGTSCLGSLSLASSSLLRYFACSGSSFALVVVLILEVLTLSRNGLTGTAVCGEDEFRPHGEDCLFSRFVTVIARRQSVAILAQVLAEQILRWRFLLTPSMFNTRKIPKHMLILGTLSMGK